MKKPGFTILELLIVILIIAILVTLALPITLEWNQKTGAATWSGNYPEIPKQ